MDADFIVVGGGIAGISAAARLAELGRVIVLEAEDALGYHASGRSAALYEPNYGSAPTIALNQASADHHHNHHGGVLSPRGLLMIGTADSQDAFAADRDAMGLTQIDLDEARAFWPILDLSVVTCAAYNKVAEDIDTDLLLGNFARTIREKGGRIVTKAAATQISRTAQGWEVQTKDQTYAAPILINAAGAWADVIAGLAGITPIGLTPLRRSMARVPAPEGHDVSAWPMLFGPGETWYSKPDAGALLVSPADEDPVAPHDAYAEDLTLAEGIARFEAHVEYETPRLLASWAGLRTFAPDRTLVIGPDPTEPSFFWCAGQGGYGMQSAPAASRLLADLVAGKPSELDAATVRALDPARFNR